MKFKYKSQSKDGQFHEGIIDATDKFAAAKQIRDKGETPLSTTSADSGNFLAKLSNISFGGKVGLQDKIMFTKNLSGMLQAGLALSRALSVLTRVTLQFSRLGVRFGIYLTLIGCLVATLYAFLRFQEFRRSLSQAVFHHPETPDLPHERSETFSAPPPPPAPPAPAPEDHRIIP